MAPKRILVVDDEIEIRTLIRTTLEREGYLITEASNGAECLAQIRDANPDLILMDIKMPNVGGISTLNVIKQHANTKNIPVIVLSGNASADDRRLVAQFGGNEFIDKPFRVRELVQKVSRQLLSLDYHGVAALVSRVQQVSKDERISAVASCLTMQPWDAFGVDLNGTEALLLLPQGFTISIEGLSEKEAKASVKVMAKIASRWKSIWPESPPELQRSSLLRRGE